MAGFREARHLVIQALQSGTYRHEPRADQDTRNLLSVGIVEKEQVVDMMKLCRGNQHETDTHHQDASVETHIFKPLVAGVVWYIKVYFEDPDTIFISVHESDYQ